MTRASTSRKRVGAGRPSLGFVQFVQAKELTVVDRAVHGATKDHQGNITKLCGPWGSASATDVIQAIQLGGRYYVPLLGGASAWIRVVQGSTGPYLRTNWDGTTRNNLDDLPPC
jgi:hypothetical protein